MSEIFFYLQKLNTTHVFVSLVGTLKIYFGIEVRNIIGDLFNVF
jgi:hypothetical protein